MVTVNNSDYYNNIPAGRDLNNLPKGNKSRVTGTFSVKIDIL